MDDFKIILYILAAVAYWVFTQWRKAFNTPEQDKEQPGPEPRRVQPQQPPRPVTSFEDILRELQPKIDRGRAEAETARETVVPPVIAASKYKNYDQTAPKEMSWEKAAEAREAEKQAKLRRQEVFKSVTKVSEAPGSRYAKLLRNPATIRDAVILSEIFNRKYT